MQKFRNLLFLPGADGEIRTPDPLITSEKSKKFITY